MRIPNKRKLKQIASNHSLGIDFKDFTKLCKYYAKEPYSFLVNDNYNLGRIYYKNDCW